MQHVVPNNVAICCVGMLRSFSRGLNTSEIPGELLRVNLTSSHLIITGYLHLKITLFSEVKRSPLAWLHNPSKRTYKCSCMIETSSVLPLKIFGYLQISSAIFRNYFLENVQKRLSGLWTNFGNLQNMFGNLWKIVKKKSP